MLLIGKRPHAELNSWFNAANVSCLLSEREGWPNVLLESLACGTPVIATSAGGIPEVISSPKQGTLVERNVPALTAALDAALKHEWDRPAMVAYAATRTWESEAARKLSSISRQSSSAPALEKITSRDKRPISPTPSQIPKPKRAAPLS